MNESYFDIIDTESKAYWLGFILSDGCVIWSEKAGNYALSIALQARDVEHLVALGQDLASTRVPRADDRYGTRRLVWYSRRLAQTLIARGISPRKSGLELPVPDVPGRLRTPFWRGVFDGDGCLSVQIKKRNPKTPEYRLSLAGSRSVLEGFQYWAVEAAGVGPQKIVRARNSTGLANTYVFYMNGNRQIAALTDALYREATRYLPRKYALHLALQEQNRRVRPSFRRRYQSSLEPVAPLSKSTTTNEC